MKKSIAGIILILVTLIFLTACKRADSQVQGDLYEPEGPLIEMTDEGVVIEWVDLGVNALSARFEYAGESLFLLEATLDGHSTKYGFMDKTGEIIIPVIYDNAHVFTYGLAYVGLGERKFFIDPSGEKVLDVSEYALVSSFENGFSVVTRIYSEEIEGGFRQTFLQGLIDKSGNEVLPCEYNQAGSFENGIIWGARDGKYLLFDNSGARITQYEYEYIAYAGEDMIIAQINGKTGYIDKNGMVVIPFIYEWAGRFSDGIAVVGYEGLSTYINTAGERITDLMFESAEDFSEERGLVMMGGLYGFIDTKGNLVIPCIYDEAYSFNGGVAVVIENLGRRRSRITPIDKYGDIAIIPKEMGYYKWNNTFIVYYDPNLGDYEVDLDFLALLDNAGNRLTGFYYSDISEFYQGLAVAEGSAGFALFYGLLNQYGAEIIPIIYEKVVIVDSTTCIVQFFEQDPETGGGRSKVGIATLPGDAATRRP